MICVKCGHEDTTTQMSHRVERGKSQECASCVAKPIARLKTKYGYCRPWHGEFDKMENPVNDDGSLVIDGFRKCGYSDCVEPTHIILYIELERIDTTWRTGVKLSAQEMIDKMNRGRF